jgi:hypothetical protein
MRAVLVVALLVVTALAAPEARADGTCPSSPRAVATWGVSASTSAATPADESPVVRARDLLARAKLLDEAASGDEKSATETAARLPALRATAKTARERADRASGDDREALVSRAEDLEADLAVSEAEVAAKRRTAAENRRAARDLRARAVRVVRDAPAEAPPGLPCDPPYHFTTDGRKVYRLECLK